MTKTVAQLVKGEKFYYTTAAASGNGVYTVAITVAAIVPVLGTDMAQVWTPGVVRPERARLFDTVPGSTVVTLVTR